MPRGRELATRQPIPDETQSKRFKRPIPNNNAHSRAELADITTAMKDDERELLARLQAQFGDMDVGGMLEGTAPR